MSLERNQCGKYSNFNGVNVSLCQNYPDILRGLTVVEECIIAKLHRFVFILKLRPSNQTFNINYRAISSHMIVVSQNSGPLTSMLPNAAL